jgi:PKD repeat protein
MKRLLQLLLLIVFLSGSIGVLAYVGLPYMPLRLTALRLNSYLYGEAEVLAADFEGEPTVGVRPLAVEFSNTSIGEYSESRWDFGDGQTSDLDDPLHMYFATGSFTVTLTISGTLGTDTITKTNYIEVHQPLRADFSANPTSGTVPFAVAFTNESSGAFTECKWDFGDGQNSESCLDPAHAYTAAGTYSVTLTISSTFDVDARTRVAYIQAYDELQADFEGEPKVGVSPSQVTFTNLTHGIYDTCSWDFGDGNTSSKCDPLNTYSMKGVYSVTLKVEGPAGEDSLTRSKYITVLQPIKTNFKAVPTEGISPLEVSFSNTSSGDYETCTWDFGDNVISRSCRDVSHTYANSGIYTVSLTTRNTIDSDTRTKEAYISVYEPVVANFRADPLFGPHPLKVVFTDESAGDYSTCFWQFGDGRSSNKCAAKHNYKSSGTYTVTLTASGLGGSDTLVRPSYIKVELGHLFLPFFARQPAADELQPYGFGAIPFPALPVLPEREAGRIGGR